MANQINLDLLWAELGGKTDPTDAKWEGGWVAEIPTYQNFNYVLNALDANLLHLAENGSFQWQTEISYEKGTLVREGGLEWFCITANSGNRPSTDNTNSYWTTGKIIGRTPVTPYNQKHGLYVADVNERTLTTWSGNDVTLENDTALVALNTTSTATGNLIFGNVGGNLVVVDVGTTVVPDGRTLSLTSNKVHKVFHEGYPPNQTQVAGTVPEAPNDGLLYSRKNKNWVKTSSTDVQTQPPPPNRGAGGGWYNLDDGQLYLDIDDGDSSQWVPSNPPIVPQEVLDAVEAISEITALLNSLSKTDVDLTTANVDWNLGIQYYKTLTEDTTLTFSNVVEGKTIMLIVDGDFALTFPEGILPVEVSSYDSTSTNYIQIYCASVTNSVYLASLVVR